MKVTTKDFQRLKGENVFEFPVGITVIQGRSGSGKSTVFYAVEDCLENPSGVADVINWDAKQAEVTIENEGEFVKWIKTPSSCEYVDKDGKPYVKASKLDSRDIADLGFYFDKKGSVVNIHNEWATLFPFGNSDTEMFKIFEDIFNISSSFQVVDSIKKDEQEKKVQINQITSQIDETTKQNSTILGILDKINAEDILFCKKHLEEKKNLISDLSKDYKTLSDNVKYIELDIPEGLDIDINDSYYNQIQQDYNNYLLNKQRELIELPESFELPEYDKQYVEAYTSYKTNLDAINQYEESLERLKEEKSRLEEQLKEIKICPTCGRPMD